MAKRKPNRQKTRVNEKQIEASIIRNEKAKSASKNKKPRRPSQVFTEDLISEIDEQLANSPIQEVCETTPELPQPLTVSEMLSSSEPSIAGLSKALTEEKKAFFLQTYRNTGRRDLACKAAGINSLVPDIWCEQDPEFYKAHELVREKITDFLVDHATKRATQGTLKPVYFKGELQGYERQYSDSLLAYLLKRQDERFVIRRSARLSRGKSTENNGAGTEPESQNENGLSRDSANDIRARFLGLEKK